MRREDIYGLIRRIPPLDHSKTVLVLRGDRSINVDIFYRMEPEYLVVRGRENGTNDEERGFFVPYEEIAYIKLERTVKLNELKRMYGEQTGPDEDLLAMVTAETAATTTPLPVNSKTPTTIPTPTPIESLDPAAIAKQNLLERIRAARTSAGVPNKPGSLK
ncbi:hypothetical protein [Fimbriiglobus ruber]|uniref:Uncharacterized protein n=1 Tax=Fimbriiglobus ruber TaxID=1908690 RepID=A0A225DUA7_9BACT|nr:hypothetical protein [Fimbriiglobus ruber]OWK43224.1 hypothetical protein FRUB_02823 [Fimbriiglobus ruber]